MRYSSLFKKCFNVAKYFAYIFEIFIFYTIQRVPNSLIQFLFNIRPIYLLPITLVITIFEGKIVGLIFSIIVGMLLDLEFSFNLGFYTIVLGILSLLISTFFEKNIKINFFTVNILVLSSVIVVFFLEFLFFFVFKGYKDAFYALINFYLPQLGFTTLTIPLFYFFNKTISNASVISDVQGASDENKE